MESKCFVRFKALILNIEEANDGIQGVVFEAN